MEHKVRLEGRMQMNSCIQEDGISRGYDQTCTIVSSHGHDAPHNIIVLYVSSCACLPPVQLYNLRQARHFECAPYWAQLFYTAACDVHQLEPEQQC